MIFFLDAYDLLFVVLSNKVEISFALFKTINLFESSLMYLLENTKLLLNYSFIENVSSHSKDICSFFANYQVDIINLSIKQSKASCVKICGGVRFVLFVCIILFEIIC